MPDHTTLRYIVFVQTALRMGYCCEQSLVHRSLAGHKSNDLVEQLHVHDFEDRQ
jgi:hypothetical protein